MLLKWKPLGIRDYSPFLDAGVSLRHINAQENARFFAGESRNSSLDRSFAQKSSFNAGFTVGGGVQIPVRERFGSPGQFTSNRDQFELMLGFLF